jgi:hypothetical protein
MTYLVKMQETWQVSSLVQEKGVSFDNPFDYAIFNLVYRFLNSFSDGPSFIEVPSKELGSENFSKNYENFCSAVLTAAVEFALEPSRVEEILPKEEINLDDYYLNPRGKVMLMVAQNRARDVSTIGTRDNSIVSVRPNFKSVKLLKEYGYNGLNGQRTVKKYIDWLKSSGKIDSEAIFTSKYKILIVSHAEIEASTLSKVIPYCSIKEDGSLNYSSPIPPFIYFARDHSTPKVHELVQKKLFDAIIMLGDKKISSSDVWSFANNYFKKAIYIGKNSPYVLDAYVDSELSRRHYSFALSEMHQYYGLKHKIQFDQRTFANDELDNLIGGFFEKLNQVDANLRFDLSLFKDLTAKISDPQKEWFLDYFDQKIITEGDYEIDYSELKEKFQDILDFLEKEGNTEKLSAFNETRNQAGKKEEVFAVVHNKFEIENLSDQLQIPESSILPLKNFGRKLRAKKNNILESRKEKIFVFLSLPYGYEGSILQALDSFNVIGERVFLTSTTKNPRITKLINARNLSNKLKMQNPVREEITGIPFEDDGIFEEIDQVGVLTSIDDLELNEYVNFAIKPKTYQRQYYNVQLLGHDESYYIAGKVVDANEIELIDLSEVKGGDSIIFYRHHAPSFETIWELIYPGFSDDILKYSEIMRDIVKRILNYQKNDFDRLFKKLQSLGLKTSFNSIKRLGNDEVTTLFPRLDTLKALKFFCEQTEEFKNHPFVKEFQKILKAKKGVELKKKLGNRLSNSLLDSYCGFEVEDVELSKLFKDNPQLLAASLESCIVLGEVKSIKKS